MRYEIFISLRYLFAKRKEKFISIISLISVLGVAVGVAALIVVLAVMSGFDSDLMDKIVGSNSHILIEREDGIANPTTVISKIEKIDHVLASSPYISGQAMVECKDNVLGVLVRGIDSSREPKVTKIGQYLKQGSLNFGDNGVIVGSELSNKFGIWLGDELSVISSASPNPQNFKVSGIFNSGMYEYDLNLIFVDLESAQALFGVSGKVSGIGVKIDNAYSAQKIKAVIQSQLGFPYFVRSWMDINKSLFSALKLEKTTMFIILALIVVVACFNIISTLIMVVMEKTKDIGILKSIGATNTSIKAIFTLEGLIIGLVGTMFGAAGGFSLCYLLKKYQFIKLPSDIYYIDRLPVQPQVMDFLIIILSAITISWLASLYPAWQASKLNPVEALRYE